MTATPRRTLSPRRLGALVLVVLVVVLLAVVLTRQREQIAALRRQQQQTAAQGAASCVVFADIGNPSLIRPSSSDLGRRIVADAGHAARILGCRR